MMFRNYFKIAWRNIIKSRFYSAVNIIGLSTGVAHEKIENKNFNYLLVCCPQADLLRYNNHA